MFKKEDKEKHIKERKRKRILTISCPHQTQEMRLREAKCS